MKAPRHLITFVALLLAGQPCRAEDGETEIVESPGKTISIRQEYEGNFKETLLFADKELKPVVLAKGECPWPSVYNFAPDEKAVLRIQKTGSGENVTMLYLIGKNGSVEEVAGFDDGLWKLADAASPLKRKDLYHTGVSLASWSADSSTLHILLCGSDSKVSGAGIEYRIIYDLKAKTFRHEPAPVNPAKSSSNQ
ncbi:MAG: hypothetical protein EOP88_06620 [Verrucomicrobiaceae bacterium]|nr:MAG: hypothetical protein EOP88_06620 [Verrucomicrobiaceae bacterium]